jgi:hypothetical protein
MQYKGGLPRVVEIGIVLQEAVHAHPVDFVYKAG